MSQQGKRKTKFCWTSIHIQSDPVLNCRILLDRDPETGSCSTLVCYSFKNQNAHEKYKKYRNKITHLLDENKRNYYQSVTVLVL